MMIMVLKLVLRLVLLGVLMFLIQNLHFVLLKNNIKDAIQ